MILNYALPLVILAEIFVYTQKIAETVKVPTNDELRYNLNKINKEIVMIQTEIEENENALQNVDYKILYYIHQFFRDLPFWNTLLPNARNLNVLLNLLFSISIFIPIYFLKSKITFQFTPYIFLSILFLIYTFIRNNRYLVHTLLMTSILSFATLSLTFGFNIIKNIEPNEKISVYIILLGILFITYDRYYNYYFLKLLGYKSFSEIETEAEIFVKDQTSNLDYSMLTMNAIISISILLLMLFIIIQKKRKISNP